MGGGAFGGMAGGMMGGGMGSIGGGMGGGMGGMGGNFGGGGPAVVSVIPTGGVGGGMALPAPPTTSRSRRRPARAGRDQLRDSAGAGGAGRESTSRFGTRPRLTSADPRRAAQGGFCRLHEEPRRVRHFARLLPGLRRLFLQAARFRSGDPGS